MSNRRVDERSQAIEFVVSDMWRAFLSVVAKRASQAVHILDRFHVVQLLTKAVDVVRKTEARALRAKGRPTTLTKTRWLLLKNRKNLKGTQRSRLRDLVRINIATVRAYLLKEQFHHFWTYRSALWAGRFLDQWTTMVMRSRIEPMKAFAKTLRRHRPRLLNWFHARRSTIAIGAVARGSITKRELRRKKPTAFEPTNTWKSPCITHSVTSQCLRG